MHSEDDVGRGEEGGREGGGITECHCMFDLNLQACHLFFPLYCGFHSLARLICIVAI